MLRLRTFAPPDSRGRCHYVRGDKGAVPSRFLPVQILSFFIYLISRNAAIVKKLSDSSTTTT